MIKASKMNVSEELKKARQSHYGIGAFNTNNLEVTKAICAAAAKFDSPILIATTTSAIEYAGLEQIFDIVTNEIKSNGIKATIHLDHAKDFSIIREAIRIGYRSIMFDGSALPFDENVHLTHRVVNFARSYGACVEAEIGVIAHEEGGRLSHKSEKSAPGQVKNFVGLTGVDSMAISVGNEHGAPENEALDLMLLKRIGEEVDIPLVMHGASGLSDSDIRQAMECGVAKFNIDTKIKQAFTSEIESSKEIDYREAIKEGMEEVEKIVSNYIKLFSNL